MNTKILIVDDEKDITDVLKDRFEQDFSEVLVASNGSEAVEIADKKRPNIVIMDINMPVMNGIEAKRIIRKSGSHIPIIFLSVRPKEELIEEMDENTFYMEKPVNFKELSLVINQQVISAN
ncbi:MAG: response regulator [Nitrospirae bacterium]|nr:response regulator [Nitrospirota bacterium]